MGSHRFGATTMRQRRQGWAAALREWQRLPAVDGGLGWSCSTGRRNRSWASVESKDGGQWRALTEEGWSAAASKLARSTELWLPTADRRSKGQWGDDLRMIWHKEERGGGKATVTTVWPLLRWRKGVAGGPISGARHQRWKGGSLAQLAVGAERPWLGRDGHERAAALACGTGVAQTGEPRGGWPVGRTTVAAGAVKGIQNGSKWFKLL
jgi:hypothetical protein